MLQITSNFTNCSAGTWRGWFMIIFPKYKEYSFIKNCFLSMTLCSEAVEDWVE